MGQSPYFGYLKPWRDAPMLGVRPTPEAEWFTL